MKRNIMKALTLCLALILCLAYPVSASAAQPAEVPDYLIDPDADCSLTIMKFDWTNAVKDGVWDVNSFTSTGVKESYVENILGGSDANNLGNGETSNGYAIKGVGFTYLKVADIVTFTESANDGHPDYNLTQVLYGFNKTASAELLAAIGLADGAGRYENADNTDLQHPEQSPGRCSGCQLHHRQGRTGNLHHCQWWFGDGAHRCQRQHLCF